MADIPARAIGAGGPQVGEYVPPRPVTGPRRETRPTPRAPGALPWQLASTAVVAAFAAVLLVLGRRHSTFEEWDGVFQVWAGREIVSGQGYHGWASHFWPPLYPLLSGLAGLVAPAHVAARAVTGAAALGTLGAAYALARELTASRPAALLAQLFLAVNPLFVRLAIQAENHMLDTLFFMWGLLFLVRLTRAATWQRAAMAGAVCALAGLSRYTSYVLFPLGALTAALCGDPRGAPREALRRAGAFTAAAALVSLPWWAYNGAVNGWPFHTWQYVNIGQNVVGRADPAVTPERWLWAVQARFGSVRDVFAAYPAAYLGNFVGNVSASLDLAVRSAGVLAPFVAAALVDALLRERRIARPALVFAVGLVLFVVLVSQAFVFAAVFLSWAVVLTVLAAVLLERYGATLRAGGPARAAAGALGVLLLLGIGARTTRNAVGTYLASEATDGDELQDLEGSTRALRAYDPHIATRRVMSSHPARAFRAGARYVQLPAWYPGDVAGLVEYAGLAERVRTYVPRYPATMPDGSLRADYLVFDRFAAQQLPQFAFLLDPGSPRVPRRFRPVYRSGEVAVYEIRPPDVANHR